MQQVQDGQCGLCTHFGEHHTGAKEIVCRAGGQAVRRSGGQAGSSNVREFFKARHPERSEGGMPQRMSPWLRSG
jgi:hypothetical protein